MRWLKTLHLGLHKSSQKISENLAGLGQFFGQTKIDADSMHELEEALILADLGVTAAGEMAETLRQHKWKTEITPDALRSVLATELAALLQPAEQALTVTEQPHIIVLVGVNGSGKTTTAGKLAAYFQQQGKKTLLAAGDTFRAAASEQLKGWGGRTESDVISAPHGSDAAALAYQAIDKARKDKADLLIIDTAGRLHNKSALMEELAKIYRVIKKQCPDAPHDSIIVLDGTVGQNAHAQVKMFQNYIPLTGMVVTKLDGTAKGGILVALVKEFGLPVHLIGVGERAEDLHPFNAEEFAAALVGIEPPPS